MFTSYYCGLLKGWQCWVHILHGTQPSGGLDNTKGCSDTHVQHLHVPALDQVWLVWSSYRVLVTGPKEHFEKKVQLNTKKDTHVGRLTVTLSMAKSLLNLQSA